MNRLKTCFEVRKQFLSTTQPLFPVIFVPFFTIIEFIGYIGWIKVAETLLNPWGDDDEDFEINYLIERNFQVESVTTLCRLECK